MSLQGKDKNVISLSDAVNTFMTKLTLWQSQLETGDLYHFHSLESIFTINVTLLEKYVTIIKELYDTFESKFRDLKTIEAKISLFNNPFNFACKDAPHDLQMELVALQNSTATKCSQKEGWDLFKSLPRETFPRLRMFAANLMTIFGSTYICEQMFSRMNQIKSQSRNRVGHEHLVHLLRLCCSSFAANIDELVGSKQCQQSH